MSSWGGPRCGGPVRGEEENFLSLFFIFLSLVSVGVCVCVEPDSREWGMMVAGSFGPAVYSASAIAG
jgi:hypothetical protein